MTRQNAYMTMHKKILPRIAVVEDNSSARLNLRSHLLATDDYDIASYSSGQELRNGLKKYNFDLILTDFHLGQTRNGAEWIEQLKASHMLNATTGIVFITSDRTPQCISQILDTNPDQLILKPYTINHLTRTVSHSLKFRALAHDVFEHIQHARWSQAISQIKTLLQQEKCKRYKNDLLKVQGRTFIAMGEYAQAEALYSEVLANSDHILWAHWGRIKSQFLAGDWASCQAMLKILVDHRLTKDKAHEWLACVAIGQKDYVGAEQELDCIRENDLSLQATKLKVLSYKMQQKEDEATRLLEKKRQSNFSIKERFDEYTLELARLFLQRAENSKPGDEQQDTIDKAKALLYKAKNLYRDNKSEQERDCMMALACLLEGNLERAEKIMLQEDMQDFTRQKITMLTDAVKVWFGLGHPEKAKTILSACDDYFNQQQDQLDSMISDDLIYRAEKAIGVSKERAIGINQQGLALHAKGDYNQALEQFNRAYKMFPGVPAFGLNLLQCLCDAKRTTFKNSKLSSLLNELQKLTLTQQNQQRLDKVLQKARKMPELANQLN